MKRFYIMQSHARRAFGSARNMAHNVKTTRYEVLVDDDDAYLLRSYVWHVAVSPSLSNPIVKRQVNGIDELLSHVIMKASPGDFVHYKDGNSLNLRRSNLELWVDRKRSHEARLFNLVFGQKS